jgi:hypothetical protein
MYYPSVSSKDNAPRFPPRTKTTVEAGAFMPWYILEMACAKGFFQVSWRRRDYCLRARCERLRRQGFLSLLKNFKSGHDTYVPTQTTLDGWHQSKIKPSSN